MKTNYNNYPNSLKDDNYPNLRGGLKFILSIVLLLIVGAVSHCYSQMQGDKKNGFEGFAQLSIDPKMALVGPYAGKPQDIGTTLDLEIAIGFEYEKAKFGFSFQSHEAIEYWKAAVFYDRILRNKLFALINARNFHSTAGFEFGMINRYFDNDPTWPLYGFNFGQELRLYWDGYDTGFSIVTNLNTSKGEEAFTKYKDTWIEKHRVEFTIGIKRNF